MNMFQCANLVKNKYLWKLSYGSLNIFNLQWKKETYFSNNTANKTMSLKILKMLSHPKSTNTICNITEAFSWWNIQIILKKTWDKIKTVETLKAKAKASLNSFLINNYSITNTVKPPPLKYLMVFLSIFALILSLNKKSYSVIIWKILVFLIL